MDPPVAGNLSFQKLSAHISGPKHRVQAIGKWEPLFEGKYIQNPAVTWCKYTTTVVPIKKLCENHHSVELQAELDFLVSAQRYCIILLLFCIRGKLLKMLEGCRVFLGETCGFPWGPEPACGVPMRCGNGSCSISLSNALLLAKIPQLTQPAPDRKT